MGIVYKHNPKEVLVYSGGQANQKRKKMQLWLTVQTQTRNSGPDLIYCFNALFALTQLAALTCNYVIHVNIWNTPFTFIHISFYFFNFYLI